MLICQTPSFRKWNHVAQMMPKIFAYKAYGLEILESIWLIYWLLVYRDKPQQLFLPNLSYIKFPGHLGFVCIDTYIIYNIHIHIYRAREMSWELAGWEADFCANSVTSQVPRACSIDLPRYQGTIQGCCSAVSFLQRVCEHRFDIDILIYTCCFCYLDLAQGGFIPAYSCSTASF